MKRLFDEIPQLTGEQVVIGQITDRDTAALRDMVQSALVYRYLPTFLFERQFADAGEAIAQMYGAVFREKESLLLGVYLAEGMQFCGIAECYGYKARLQKTCIGYRLSEAYWGRGIATQAVALLTDYLQTQTDIEIITASTMIENHASARVLEKNGFLMTAASVPEDWGYPKPTAAKKWLL